MKDPNKIELNGFDYEFNEEKREWLWKAVPMKEGVHGEKPQFAVIEKIEEEYSKEFEKRLKFVVKDIAKYLAV